MLDGCKVYAHSREDARFEFTGMYRLALFSTSCKRDFGGQPLPTRARTQNPVMYKRKVFQASLSLHIVKEIPRTAIP